METLKTPTFKSKVEQFYFENGAASEELVAASDGGDGDEVFSEPESPGPDLLSRRITEARRRAYSGDGRKSFFTANGSEPASPPILAKNGFIIQHLLKCSNISQTNIILFAILHPLNKINNDGSPGLADGGPRPY